MDEVIAYIDKIDWHSVLAGGLRILLILVVVWVVLSVLRRLLNHWEQLLKRRGQQEGQAASEAAKRSETLVMLLRQAVLIMVWLMAVLVILRELGVDIAPILAGAGVLGLAIGFGAQNLVRDVISGFFLILENQMRIGDVAIINGTGGLVEKINFRTTVLRDLSGVVHIFPNGTISTLSNMTAQWSAYVMDIGVAYKEDTDQVTDVMKRVGQELRADDYFGPLMIDDLEVFGVDQFGDSAVVVKARLKTHPIRQWEVGREYRRRLKKAFDEAGIEIPFPHRALYFGEASKPFLAELMNGRAPDTAPVANPLQEGGGPG